MVRELHKVSLVNSHKIQAIGKGVLCDTVRSLPLPLHLLNKDRMCKTDISIHTKLQNRLCPPLCPLVSSGLTGVTVSHSGNHWVIAGGEEKGQSSWGWKSPAMKCSFFLSLPSSWHLCLWQLPRLCFWRPLLSTDRLCPRNSAWGSQWSREDRVYHKLWHLANIGWNLSSTTCSPRFRAKFIC